MIMLGLIAWALGACRLKGCSSTEYMTCARSGGNEIQGSVPNACSKKVGGGEEELVLHVF